VPAAHPRLRRVALLALVLPSLLLLAPAAPAAAAPCASSPSVEFSTPRAIRLELRCLINAERGKRGLRRLRPNGALFRAATSHARDIVRRRRLTHYSRAGEGPASRVADTGYLRNTSRWAVGENIGWHTGRDVRSIVSSWMASPGHRRALLLPRFRELGLGVVKSSPSGNGRGLTAVVDFGDRALR
jgi:uncharacterized protein YkwD